MFEPKSERVRERQSEFESEREGGKVRGESLFSSRERENEIEIQTEHERERDWIDFLEKDVQRK
jgi:hypothetical protein